LNNIDLNPKKKWSHSETNAHAEKKKKKR